MGRGAQRTKANNYNLLWLKQKELVCGEKLIFPFIIVSLLIKSDIERCVPFHVKVLLSVYVS